MGSEIAMVFVPSWDWTSHDVLASSPDIQVYLPAARLNARAVTKELNARTCDAPRKGRIAKRGVGFATASLRLTTNWPLYPENESPGANSALVITNDCIV